MSHRLMAFLVMFLVPGLAQAQTTGQNAQVGALGACRSMTVDSERLACYDRVASELVDAVARGDVTVLRRDDVAKARRSLFGFNLPDLPFFGKRDGDDPPRELVTTLGSLRMYAPDRYRFTIQDGDAVWETTESVYMGKPKSGAKVTIRRGPLGGHFVQIERSQWARARRIR